MYFLFPKKKKRKIQFSEWTASLSLIQYVSIELLLINRQNKYKGFTIDKHWREANEEIITFFLLLSRWTRKNKQINH
jgi:hypothetical protein